MAHRSESSTGAKKKKNSIELRKKSGKEAKEDLNWSSSKTWQEVEERLMPRWSVGSLCGRRLAQPGDNGGDQGEREYQLGGTDDVNVFVMRTRSNIYWVAQMMVVMIVLVKTFFSNRGRSFPVGAFNKGLTNCKGVSLTFFQKSIL